MWSISDHDDAARRQRSPSMLLRYCASSSPCQRLLHRVVCWFRSLCRACFVIDIFDSPYFFLKTNLREESFLFVVEWSPSALAKGKEGALESSLLTNLASLKPAMRSVDALGSPLSETPIVSFV
mmetsp:Transcript_19841/g.47657  ORF Transcript_19841/g.47657 Transcript_19841/m.47657 type:complete len:124 (+) Transcript_19841:521-892(+)